MDKLKQDTPIISEDFKNLASRISTMSRDDYPKKWLEWAKSFDVTDKAAVQFFTEVDNGKRKIKDIDDYIKKAEESSTAFGAALKNVAANIGIMLAITVTLKLLGAAWDHFNVTVEESQAKVDEVTAKLKELNEEYDKLNSRDSDSLTSSEKERLNYLKDRISYEEELLDIEKKKQYQEQIGGGFTDLFDKDSDSYKKWIELVNDFGKNEVREGFWHGTIDSNIDEYNQALANAKDITDKLEEARKGGHGEDSYYVKQLRDR
ncbi:MAG: hypothetical protein JTJ28_16220 [Lactobacillus sp.]|nr:hypothetical protein [Lactobacillus sp.]